MKNVEKKNTLFPVSGSGIFFLIFLMSFSSSAQDSLQPPLSQRIAIKGFIKDMQSASFTDNSKSLITGNYIHNRINFKWNISNNFHLRLESRNRLYYGEQVKTTPDFGKYIDTDNGYIDLTYNVVSDTSIVLNATLDRALLNWSKNKVDITVGRQRINWGINLVWNPNDIFNTFNYFDFDYEERPGSDAVRIQYNAGIFSSFQAAYKPSKDKNKQVAALMYKTNIGKYDWQNFAGVYQEDMVAGIGWAGNIKQTGFKGEAAYFHSYKTIDTIGVLVSSISIDRTLKKNYFVMASYLYNSGGKDIFYSAADATKINLSVKNLMPFIHTFFAQVAKSINPLVNAGFSVMFSPTKNSLILFPIISVSLSDSWDLSFIAQSFFADVNTTYRTMGNAVCLRLRWSY